MTRYDWIKTQTKTIAFYLTRAKATLYSVIAGNPLTVKELVKEDSEFAELIGKIREEYNEILKILKKLEEVVEQ
ncbi:hypothetical protein DRP04_02630 [Archaeoglobales archaeon]|nr:MAG: hypothetical protein DRP04_02630 [Archaeoglobales archaeon]HDN74281.1 hypothetical protein [Archaeoglobus sp.]